MEPFQNLDITDHDEIVGRVAGAVQEKLGGIVEKDWYQKLDEGHNEGIDKFIRNLNYMAFLLYRRFRRQDEIDEESLREVSSIYTVDYIQI